MFWAILVVWGAELAWSDFGEFPGKGLDLPGDGLHGNFAGGLGGFWAVFRDWSVCQDDWVGSGGFTVACVGGAEENEAFGLKHTI